MGHDPGSHHRRSIRLPGCDYAQPGAYFVRLCTRDRECLFGEIVEREVRLNAFGEIVRTEWIRTAKIRPSVRLCDDELVVMPNHIHGIIWIVDDDNVRATGGSPVRPRGPDPGSVGAIIAGFKSAVTRQINTLRKTPGAPVWQRNYYEHVIRNEDALHAIRVYITENPLRWTLDRYYPVPAERDPR